MKVAALDLGSNTFLLLIATVEKGKIKKVHKDVSEYVRISEGVNQTGFLCDEALKRAEKTFSKFKKIIDKEKVKKISAVATSAARDAKNQEVFLNLAKKYEIPVEIISGKKEALLTFSGCVGGEVKTPKLVVDVGGYSTEVTYCLGEKTYPTSLNVGAVRLMELFFKEISSLGLIGEDTLNRMRKEVIKQSLCLCKDIPSSVFWSEVWAVGGTPLSLLGLLKNNSKLDLENLSLVTKTLASMELEQRKAFLGKQSLRADILPMGALILETLAYNLNLWGYEASSKGVRFGLAFSLA